MKGNQNPGNNIKSFGDGKQIEKGTDPMPRGRGQLPTQEMSTESPKFSRTKDTTAGF